MTRETKVGAMARNWEYRDFLQPSIDLNDRSILITGGTGSFGKAFVKIVLKRYKPKRLVIYSRDELKQSEMAEAISDADRPRTRFFIGDVRDRTRLEMAMRDIEFVIHAAALKQVPAAEYNPMECINTNVLGAENVVQAALRSRVRRVLALSTDKAANPINLYGASKLASDKIFVAANNLSGSVGTKFSVVRYGNVVGSRGSVMPLFQKLIDKNAESLPITDPRMTRFWISLEQCVNFVLSSIAMMKGGEISVPKIPSMRLVDMAEAMSPGRPHRTVGIRPVEKLHEVMITSDDARSTLELDDRYIVTPTDIHGTGFHVEGARRVPENFAYTSDTNTDWLDADGLGELIKTGTP